MTFTERYKAEGTWWGKILIMELFHLTAVNRDKGWTLFNTAQTFECSTALVSENLLIAKIGHTYPVIYEHDTRNEALIKARRFK